MLRFVRANARWLLAGLLLTMFSSFGQTFFIGLSGNELRAAFSLSDGEFGTIYMLATLGSALTLPWLGKFLDVLPGRKMALFVMPALAAPCVLLAYVPHMAVLALAIYLLRLLGQGMMTHIALTEVSRWFVANRGRAISLIGPGHQAGEAFFPVVFVLVAAAFGWQFAWTAAAGITLLIALPVIHLLMRVERVPTHADALHADVDNTPGFAGLLAARPQGLSSREAARDLRNVHGVDRGKVCGLLRSRGSRVRAISQENGDFTPGMQPGPRYRELRPAPGLGL